MSPSNGFYFYMLHLRSTQGKSFKNMEEVSRAAGPIWTNMTANQKEPFIAQAKLERENGKKLTNLHEDLDALVQMEKKEAELKTIMETDIKSVINCLSCTTSLGENYFHIIHINKFCTVRDTEKDLPAEIALIRFNIKEGVLEENVYHSMINPGTLPLGYRCEVKLFAEKTHQLEYPDEDSELPNMGKVLKDIVSFLSKDCEHLNASLPPIYVKEKDKKVVSNVLKDSCLEYSYSEDTFRVYSLEFLFFTLRNGISPDWPTINQAVGELERDVFDYTKGICCEYHENTDAPLYCSRSIVIRSVYIICDNCCKVLNIPIIPGRHVKLGSKLIEDPPSRAASVSSYHTGRLTTRDNSVYNDDLLTDDTSDMLSLMSFNTDFTEDNWTIKKRGHKKTNILTPPTFTSDENTASSQSRPVRRPTSVAACFLNDQVAPVSSCYEEVGVIDEECDKEILVKSIGKGRGRARTIAELNRRRNKM